MLDSELIDAFIDRGSKQAFAETLHIEGDVILLDGYWHVCLRVSPNTFLVRAEEPPMETTVIEDLATALKSRHKSHVASDLPGITVLTMEKASLGYVEWDVWADDLAQGKADVDKAVTTDTELVHGDYYEIQTETDYTAELHGARRLAGLPTSVILSIGVGTDRLDSLGEVLDDCVFVPKRFGEIDADQCGSLVPTLILVEASEQVGREFVMQLRAASCSRVLPLIAVTPGGEVAMGADAAVDGEADPHTWAPRIRNLLP